VSKKVLVVDDVASDLKRISDILAGLDTQVIVANNGKEAVEKAQTEQPDLIFMDVVMPEVDGYSACRQITTNEITKNIPVVIVSSKNQKADKVWAQLQGAAGMVSKPYENEEIIDKFNSLIR
jgi:twitching motility two-component system response regulator PilH